MISVSPPSSWMISKLTPLTTIASIEVLSSQLLSSSQWLNEIEFIIKLLWTFLRSRYLTQNYFLRICGLHSEIGLGINRKGWFWYPRLDFAVFLLIFIKNRITNWHFLFDSGWNIHKSWSQIIIKQTCEIFGTKFYTMVISLTCITVVLRTVVFVYVYKLLSALNLSSILFLPLILIPNHKWYKFQKVKKNRFNILEFFLLNPNAFLKCDFWLDGTLNQQRSNNTLTDRWIKFFSRSIRRKTVHLHWISYVTDKISKEL